MHRLLSICFVLLLACTASRPRVCHVPTRPAPAPDFVTQYDSEASVTYVGTHDLAIAVRHPSVQLSLGLLTSYPGHRLTSTPAAVMLVFHVRGFEPEAFVRVALFNNENLWISVLMEKYTISGQTFVMVAVPFYALDRLFSTSHIRVAGGIAGTYLFVLPPSTVTSVRQYLDYLTVRH